jgi:hypothetical protein
MQTIPALIGKYEVVKRLRQGGMGTLYLAHDPRLLRPVAIKVIRADIDSPVLRERFERGGAGRQPPSAPEHRDDL